MSDWTFLTNHGHAIVYLSMHPDARVRDVAVAVGITERAAQRILRDLVSSGYLSARKEGRRNSYSLNRKKHLRHPIENDHRIGDLLEALTRD